MLWNRSSATILRTWQTEIDHCLETGQSPLLQLGESLEIFDALPGIIALRELMEQRPLANVPYVVIGSKGPTWLLALWQRRSQKEWTRKNSMRLVFGGADAATTLASTTITGGAEADRLHYWQEVRPLALAARIEPQSQPAVPLTIDSLPVAAIENGMEVAENQLQDWIAWLAVAFVLIVIALSVAVQT